MADTSLIIREVLTWTMRALQGLDLLRSTGWMGEDATRIVGKLSDVGLPIAESLNELKDKLEGLLASGEPITLEQIEAINDEATAAEDKFIAMLESKVID